MRQALESTPVDPASGIQATSMIPTRDVTIIGSWVPMAIYRNLRTRLDRHARRSGQTCDETDNGVRPQGPPCLQPVCLRCVWHMLRMAAIRARGRSVISNGRLEVADPKLKLNRPSRTLWRARAWGGVGGGFMNIFEWLHTWYRWDYLSGIYGMSMRHGCPTFPGHFDSRLCGCHGGSAVWLPWRFRLCGCHGGSAVWLRQRFPV